MNQRTIVILSFALFVTALLWGSYSLIIYLGIPIHQLVYAPSSVVEDLSLACGGAETNGVYFCKGAAVLAPFVGAVIKMASPFYAYIFFSVFIAGGFLVYAGFKTGQFEIHQRWRPASIVLAFLGMVWLLGFTFSVGTLHNLNTPDNQKIANLNGERILPPFRRFFEPLPQVYGGAGAEALQELTANYEYLLSRGCLKDTGAATQNGAKLYDMRAWCVQWSFFQRVGVQAAMVGLFLFNLLVLGRFLLLSVLQLRTTNPLLLTCLSLGVGALAWVMILWLLGIVTLLQPWVVRTLFFGMPFLLFRQSRWWLQESWKRSIDVHFSFKNWHVVLVWLLLSYLALNFFNVVRPFPIGWDDLGSYLNRPRLLASYGNFIPSMSQFQWEYLTSLGFLLFGYDSWTGSTFAMQINWAAGLLAVLSVYAVARRMFGKGRGVLAAMLYYFLPMTGHFSFADMKIDNASFFTTVLGVLAAYAYLFPSQDEAEHERRDPRLLVVAGLLLGFSFAIKPTAILGILMVGAIVVGAIGGRIAFIGAVIAGFGILQKFGALNITEIFSRSLIQASVPANIFAIVVLLTGFGLMGYAVYRNKNLLRPLGVSAGMLAVGIGIAVGPWMLHNIAIAKGFNITGYLLAEDKEAFREAAKRSALPYINTSVMLSAMDLTAPQIGYAESDTSDTMGPVHFLPEELRLDPKNGACISSARTEELDRYWGFGRGISHYLTLAWRQVMNLDSFGYYVTLMPALLLFPLLLLLPYFWSEQGRPLRLLFAGTFIFFVQWSFVGNGVPWYGIGMFLGFAVGLEAFIAKAPDSPNRWLIGFFLTMSILVCLSNRFWQFDSQKNLFEYPLGKITASALREVTIPQYDDIREIVVDRHETMPETPYTYRIGTFISYFIPRNREIFPLADHQMNFFNCLNQERDHVLTLRRLRALGFNSIIFDTNTHTIEKDQNGPLHQKVARFLEFANDPQINLEIPVNDPGNGIAFILLPDAPAAGTGSTVQ